MSGHGWVTPNPDGSKARCGGPALCGACAREKAAAEAAPDGGIVSTDPTRIALRADPRVLAAAGLTLKGAPA